MSVNQENSKADNNPGCNPAVRKQKRKSHQPRSYRVTFGTESTRRISDAGGGCGGTTRTI